MERYTNTDTRLLTKSLVLLASLFLVTQLHHVINHMQCLRTIDWIRSEGHTGVVRHLQADSWKIVSAADDKTLKVT